MPAEPLPCAPASPHLVPGPITPLQAPMGPPDCLSLPFDHNSAFPCEEMPLEKACYFHIGTQSLARQRLGNLPLAVVSPEVLDTGAPSPENADVLVNLRDRSSRMNFGVRGTVGYFFGGGWSLEATGFYVGENERTIHFDYPTQINSFFHNPPIGFEGNNDLWRQADRMTLEKKTYVMNGELNCRTFDPGIGNCEIIFGVRFLEFRDRIAITTDDDNITFPGINPIMIARYEVDAINRIAAPQIGFEWGFLDFGCFTFGINGKAAAGVNFVDISTKLSRGDGFVGFEGGRTEVQFSHMYDLGGYVDLHILERMRMRFGYNILWLANISVNSNQIEFDLSIPNGREDKNGSVYLHGLMAEFQFLF